MSDGAHHEQQAQSIAHEAGYADQHAAREDDDAVEQLAARHLAAREARPSVREEADTDSPYDERARRADGDEDEQREQDTDVPRDRDERRDLDGEEQQRAEKEHDAG